MMTLGPLARGAVVVGAEEPGRDAAVDDDPDEHPASVTAIRIPRATALRRGATHRRAPRSMAGIAVPLANRRCGHPSSHENTPPPSSQNTPRSCFRTSSRFGLRYLRAWIQLMTSAVTWSRFVSFIVAGTFVEREADLDADLVGVATEPVGWCPRRLERGVVVAEQICGGLVAHARVGEALEQGGE